MASTHSTERFQPLAPWDTEEARYEARAVAETVARREARRARRRAAWGMHPALAYLTIVVVAVLLIAIALLTVELAGMQPADPDVVTESVPATTTTGTTVQP